MNWRRRSQWFHGVVLFDKKKIIHDFFNKIQRTASSATLGKKTILFHEKKLDERIHVDKPFKSKENLQQFLVAKQWNQEKLNVNLEKMWTNIKDCFNFFDNFYMVFIYHNALREICCMHTHTQTLTMIIFFWKIRIVPATQNFSFCFNRLTKLTTFAPAVITNPLFAQNVLELTLVLPEAATRGVLFKNLFLEISLYSQKNTCAEVSFWKIYSSSGMELSFKKNKLQHRCFLVKFSIFLRAPFFCTV